MSLIGNNISTKAGGEEGGGIQESSMTTLAAGGMEEGGGVSDSGISTKAGGGMEEGGGVSDSGISTKAGGGMEEGGGVSDSEISTKAGGEEGGNIYFGSDPKIKLAEPDTSIFDILNKEINSDKSGSNNLVDNINKLLKILGIDIKL
ncbi:hypothetical protein [Agarilytica rhodophyticola]|uniref:hypothetical protein n=1 Tax=Agarilytica rhodophyticola TaxID=1737490 RepID=UPI000B3434D0|nr:hypothetical protein [Agarilytica rhodophyticola]